METVDLAIIGGGQSGLSTAHIARGMGITPVVLEAADEAVGSWPHYYDSLSLFSPARFSALPGMPFPGDPWRYPTRDEVVAYLRGYAAGLDAEIRTRTRVTSVAPTPNGLAVSTADGPELTAKRVIAATGGFGSPHRPDLPGLETFTGRVLHAAEYTTPKDFAGMRAIVVGAGNSAVQIAADLGPHARVTLATRGPLKWMPQRIVGRDFHWWTIRSGLDSSALGARLQAGKTMAVIDDGRYKTALASGNPDHRPMFARLSADGVTWTDGTIEKVDAIILATGYRPDLPYLTGIGALDDEGLPIQRKGVSTTVRGLGYVGLEYQRSLASASLRGSWRDARYVLSRLRL
ncbi:NAD(P)-binding domain-containing protein [Phytomonospora sp. NPDC050363]|uniref:flavin-containing monooxygenase n=1 Tax=Phytomonospora sp. NPDC050363 TaxID=3155642 RepID=UPI0033CA8C0A